MTRLLALLSAFALLAAPASAADPAPTPDCHGIQITDKSGDSANSLETSQTGSPSSDLIAGFITYDPASGKAAANIQVDNLTAGEVDAPYDAISWEMAFSIDGKAPRYVRAYQDITGIVKYTWGEPRAVTDDQTAPRLGGTTTGALFEGKGGIIKIDIPLTDMGIKDGSVLKGLALEVRQWASLPAAVPNTPLPLYSPAPVYDDAAGKGSFTVGPCTAPAPVLTPGSPSEVPTSPTSQAAPATLDVKVKVPKLKSKKLRKGRKIVLRLTGNASRISAALHRGSSPDGKVVATGKRAKLKKGKGKLKLKLKTKLKRGKYTLTLAGRNADGRAAAGSLAIRVR